MVDRESPIPIYRQLKLQFKQQINAGLLHPGDRLPTERELCERYGISRAPARQALTELAREGYVYRRAGRGTFVAREVTSLFTEKLSVRVLLHYDDPWISSLEQAVKQWNRLRPEREMTLDFTTCPRDKFHDHLQWLVAQGEAPDIASMDCVWIVHYARSGYLRPFDTERVAWLRAAFQDLEAPVKRYNVIDGQLYGLPYQTDVTGLWYRRDWFEAEGLGPPETWQDWLELIDHFACPQTRSRVGCDYAVAFPVSPTVGEATVNLLISFLWSAGAALNGKHGFDLNSSAVQDALSYLKEITLGRRACLPPNMGDVGWWAFPRLLAEGKVPMLLGATYEMPFIRDNSAWDSEGELTRHLGFVSAPRPSAEIPPVGSLGGMSWTVLRQSPQPEISLELLKLATAPETLSGFAKENLQLTPYRSINRRLATDVEHPWYTLAVPLLSTARPRPLLGDYPQVSRFLQNLILQVLWEGAPLQETLERTAELLALL
jgi:ABC-type glycerol-3-phosphate transport system substrate-binding protein